MHTSYLGHPAWVLLRCDSFQVVSVKAVVTDDGAILECAPKECAYEWEEPIS